MSQRLATWLISLERIMDGGTGTGGSCQTYNLNNVFPYRNVFPLSAELHKSHLSYSTTLVNAQTRKLQPHHK